MKDKLPKTLRNLGGFIRVLIDVLGSVVMNRDYLPNQLRILSDQLSAYNQAAAGVVWPHFARGDDGFAFPLAFNYSRARVKQEDSINFACRYGCNRTPGFMPLFTVLISTPLSFSHFLSTRSWIVPGGNVANGQSVQRLWATVTYIRPQYQQPWSGPKARQKRATWARPFCIWGWSKARSEASTAWMNCSGWRWPKEEESHCHLAKTFARKQICQTTILRVIFPSYYP